MTRLTFVAGARRVFPPWLRRIVGGPVVEGMAEILDDQVDRMVEGVKKRFPTSTNDALAFIGRERRIRRGPAESATSYAARLLPWWDDHKVRGGPYAMLKQLRLFWLAALNAPIDLIYYAGTMRRIDRPGDITRTSIVWSADATAEWAKIWVAFRIGGPLFYTVESETYYSGTTWGLDLSADDPNTQDLAAAAYFSAGQKVAVYDWTGGTPVTGTVDGIVVDNPLAPTIQVTFDATWTPGTADWTLFAWDIEDLPSAILIDHEGEPLVDASGNVLVVAAVDPLPQPIAEEFRVVVRDWNAAHIKRATIVLIYGRGALWDYPQPIPTWDLDSANGETWDDELPAIVLVEGDI